MASQRQWKKRGMREEDTQDWILWRRGLGRWQRAHKPIHTSYFVYSLLEG
jgi:hypothetical protein